MGGFFGTISKRDCVMDVFFGTDYHSHLGTKRGGMAVYDAEFYGSSIRTGTPGETKEFLRETSAKRLRKGTVDDDQNVDVALGTKTVQNGGSVQVDARQFLREKLLENRDGLVDLFLRNTATASCTVWTRRKTALTGRLCMWVRQPVHFWNFL